MEEIFCISGLGADERVFHKLEIQHAKLHYVSWFKPSDNESIETYAGRMSQSISCSNPILMGVSFGGMMAVEIAKHIPVKKVILISSVKLSSELPQWMKLSGQLRLNKLAPSKQPQWFAPIENYFLGADSQEEKKMAMEFRKTIDPVYLHWAIDKVVNWQNSKMPSSYVHIHGTKDKTFPIKNIKPTHIVDGGNHFMVINKAREVGGLIQSTL